MLVLVPLTRGMEPPGTGPRVLSQIVRRFRYIVWPALIVLILTGIGNVAYNRVTWSRVTSGDLFDTTFGQLLSIKVGLIAVALLFSAMHDFIIGPRLSTLMQAREASSGRDSKEAMRLRKVVSWLTRLNLLLAAGYRCPGGDDDTRTPLSGRAWQGSPFSALFLSQS